MTSLAARGRTEAARYVAMAAAAVTAALYYLIGLGVLYIGTAKSGEATDLFAFGAMVGTVFAVTTLALFMFRSRAVWAAVALVQVVVIVGYFALGSIREPSFELWGLLIKACQVVVLGSVTYLLLRGSRAVG